MTVHLARIYVRNGPGDPFNRIAAGWRELVGLEAPKADRVDWIDPWTGDHDITGRVVLHQSETPRVSREAVLVRLKRLLSPGSGEHLPRNLLKKMLHGIAPG